MGFKKSRANRKNRTSIDFSTPEGEQELQDRVQTASFPSASNSVNSKPESVSDAKDEVFISDAEEKERIKKAVSKIPEVFSPEQVAWVFDAYVALICFVYSLLLKTEYKALEEELRFDEEQKIQMSKPLARIASKYAPSEWAGMSAEIELITCLGIWTVSSFKRAQNVQKAEIEKHRDATRTAAVDPMPRPRMPA
jgi:hypothetical protein